MLKKGSQRPHFSALLAKTDLKFDKNMRIQHKGWTSVWLLLPLALFQISQYIYHHHSGNVSKYSVSYFFSSGLPTVLGMGMTDEVTTSVSHCLLALKDKVT